MSNYSYPENDLNRSQQLLELLGSYWANTFAGNSLLQSIVDAKATITAQTHLNLLETLASISRFDIPVFHTENWHLLTFSQSEVNTSPRLVKRYGETNKNYNGETGDFKYDGVTPEFFYAVAVPENLIECKVILNRITASSLTLAKNTDFFLENGLIHFKQNPFDNPLVFKTPVWKNNEIIEYEASLWLFRGQWDWDYVYEQFGYALGVKLKSSEGYKQLLNAVIDALVEGTKLRDLHYAWAAITGVPLVIEKQETVQATAKDTESTWVITDQHAYAFHPKATITVTTGQVVNAGDTLADVLEFFEFTDGKVPADLQGLVLGKGLLGAGFYGEIYFENKEVPLLVSFDKLGNTKVSWELGGFPGDIEKFWDDTHLRGVYQGRTLAQYLDLRGPTAEGQPTAASLPKTVNPLKFLCENLLRFHVFIVKIKADKLSRAKLGLHVQGVLRKIIPPQAVMLVVVDTSFEEEPIDPTQPGNEYRAGYSENIQSYPVMTASDSIGPDMISENIRTYTVNGKCV